MTEIQAAIKNMKAEFSSKFEGILTGTEIVEKDISNSAEHVTRAEM